MNWKKWLVRSALLGAVLIPTAAWAANTISTDGCCPLCQAILGR